MYVGIIIIIILARKKLEFEIQVYKLTRHNTQIFVFANSLVAQRATPSVTFDQKYTNSKKKISVFTTKTEISKILK